MRDYGAEMGAYLDAVKAREQLHIDRVFAEIGCCKRVCVFGAGMTSETVVGLMRRLTDIKIDFLCDNDPEKWGKLFSGDLVCRSPAELSQHKDEVGIVVATKYCKEVYAQLRAEGYSRIYFIPIFFIGENASFFRDRENIDVIKKNVLRLVSMLADERSREIAFELIKIWFDFDIDAPGYAGICTNDEYFPPGIIELGREESFVDGGAYDGDSLLRFVEQSHGEFNAIYSFELDAVNFRALEANVARLDPHFRERIELFNIGLWDAEQEINYETGNTRGQNSRIQEGAPNNGKVVRMSDALRGREVTFIKTDLEGADLRALQGAEEIVRAQEPKLAICVYHKLEHLWQIPFYLKSLVPRYRLFLRHHSTLEYGTVCYAVI